MKDEKKQIMEAYKGMMQANEASTEVTEKLKDNLNKVINQHIKDGTIYFSKMLSNAFFPDELELELDKSILINALDVGYDAKSYRAFIRKIKNADDIDIIINNRMPDWPSVKYQGSVDIDGDMYTFNITSDISA